MRLVTAITFGAIERLVGTPDRFTRSQLARLAPRGTNADRDAGLIVAVEAERFDRPPDVISPLRLRRPNRVSPWRRVRNVRPARAEWV